MAAADLASIAASNGSQESFHSSHSEQRSAVDLRVAAAVQAATPQGFELKLPDVENFLNEPSTIALLASQACSKKRIGSPNQQPEGSSGVSVQAAPQRTSHYVPLLYLEAQQRGLTPEFEYEGDQLDGFQGSVTVAGQTFSSDKRWPNKKEAKEGLSEMALPFVKAVERPVKVSSTPQENWVGKLLEYHNATSPTGPLYTEYVLSGTSFACTCEIPGHPTPFGGKDIPFTSKKAARVNAARDAMQYIISQGLTEADGSLKSKKKAKFGTAVKVDNNSPTIRKSMTFSHKVNELSSALGLGSPFYQLSSKPEAPTIFSGAAHFPTSPIFPRPFGEIRNVYGKNNAKEECARNVLEVLKDLAKNRGVDLKDVLGEDEDAVMEN